MIAGNHDLPRASDGGCILRLFSSLGVHVVDNEPRRLTFEDRGLAILAVPDSPGARPALIPDPAFQYNVLVLHGEVEGMLPPHVVAADRSGIAISREDLGISQWSYIALGHYHVYREIAPNAYYSGSLDYTSANAWGELTEERTSGIRGKGFIERNLATGEHRFHALAPSRPLIDLRSISARGMSVAELDAAVRDACEGCEGGIDEKIVRLVIRDVPRHIAREIDQKALREYRRRALHFHLDTRRPEIFRVHGHGAPGRRPSLKDVVQEKLQSRPLESDIPRDQLVALGVRYLDAVESAEAKTTSAVAEGA
jgi:exonuclease SbcD